MSTQAAIQQQRKLCFPYCKVPDKRDFMDSNPPKSNEDFYRNYDPWIGIGTAIILALFFALIAMKICLRWLLRSATVWRYHYQKYHKREKETVNHLITCNIDLPMMIPTTASADNGHAVIC